MLTRRDFLRGLIASVASAALVKNGVAQPEQVVGVDWAEGADRSVATVFDMAANTWRERQSLGHMLLGTFDAWVQMANPPDAATVRMRAAITEEYLPETDDLGGYLIPPEHLKEVRQFLKDGGVARGHSIVVPFEDTTLEEVARLRGIDVWAYPELYDFERKWLEVSLVQPVRGLLTRKDIDRINQQAARGTPT